jgi:methyl-accepting chemotaxis protein
VPGSAVARWPLVGLTLASCVAAGLSWQGGWLGLTGFAVMLGAAYAAYAWTQGRLKTPTTPTPVPVNAVPVTTAAHTPKSVPAAKGPSASERGHGVMISEVLPVWARQLDVTRETADSGLAQVLDAFTQMTSALDSLMLNLQGLGATSAPGAVDAAVQEAHPALDALLKPALRACERREAALAALSDCAENAAHLEQLTHRVLDLGRHMRLLAFNASIEANRHGKADAGTGAVATEMRLLASRMGECGSELQRRVTTQRERLNAVVNGAVTDQSTPEEMRMEIDLRAREALQQLLLSVGASMSSSSAVRESSTAVRDNLEAAFVHFQFGDRISQMLSILGSDINNFVEWTAHNPAATRDDAVEWLKRLEASYTMDEQRAEHHGNAHVDRGSEVEFF